MKQYCVGLNLKIPLFKEGITLNDFPKIRHSKIDVDTTVNPQILNLLISKNLFIYFAEVFYAGPFLVGGIHTDCGGLINDIAKISWVFGGQDSLMHWYRPLGSGKSKITDINSDYVLYTRSRVELIYSNNLKTPSLVQAGIPHNTSNDKEERYCFTFILADCITRKPICMDRAIELFNEYT
jgi:hypothetical protein